MFRDFLLNLFKNLIFFVLWFLYYISLRPVLLLLQFVISKLFHKYKYRLVPYETLCRFLAVWDIIVKNPNRKKNFMEETHDLGLELWLGYIVLNDMPILALMWLKVMPPIIAKIVLRYVFIGFPYDFYMALGIMLSYRLYWYNVLMLPLAFFSWICKHISYIFINWVWGYSWLWRRSVVFFGFKKFHVFCSKIFQHFSYKNIFKSLKNNIFKKKFNKFYKDEDNI